MTLTLTGTKLILGSQGLIDLTNNPIPCFFDDLDSTPLGSEFLSAHTPDVDFSGTGWVDLGDQGNAGSDDWLVTNGGSAFIGDGTRDYAANAAAVPSIIRGRWIGQPGSTIYLLWRAPTTVDVSDGTPAGSGDTAPCFKVRLFVDPGGTTLSAALLDNTGSTMDSIVIPVSAPFDISFSIVDDGSNINVVGSFGLAYLEWLCRCTAALSLVSLLTDQMLSLTMSCSSLKCVQLERRPTCKLRILVFRWFLQLLTLTIPLVLLCERRKGRHQSKDLNIG
jgi:hypothetical protein